MDELGEKTSTFLKEFSLNFLKFYPLSVIELVKGEVDEGAESPNAKKLKYRSWDSIERENTLEGWVYYQSGQGIGAMSSKKRVYVKENEKYNLVLYKDDKEAAKANGKPLRTISLLGYTLETNVTKHFKETSAATARELSMEEPEVGYSSYSWALVHPIRDNFVFQLHKSKSGGCLCIGGGGIEEDSEGVEFETESKVMIEQFKKCMEKTPRRDLENCIVSKTFDKVISKMCANIEELDGFADDGMNDELLMSMLYKAIYEATVKKEIIEQLLQTPEMIRLSAYFKSKQSVVTVLSKAVKEAWTQMSNQVKNLHELIYPKLKEGLAPILEAQVKVRTAISEKISSFLTDAIKKVLTPLVLPLLKCLTASLRPGTDKVKALFEEHSKEILSDGTMDDGAIKKLNSVPRKEEVELQINKIARQLAKPLDEIKEKNLGILEHVNIEEVVANLEKGLLLLLDAAVFSLQEEMKSGTFEEALAKVNEDLKWDSRLMQVQFAKAFIVNILLSNFKKHVDPHVMQLLDALSEVIPEAVNDVLNLEAEYDELIRVTIQKPVEDAIDSILG